MSVAADTTTTATTNELPVLPETRINEPLVQCGVLYLGTGPPSAGLRGLTSIQEPFSHRYPVDGTNTVRGIDAVLSVYDNGIQLAFARHPHTVMFFPIAAVVYCASLRFAIVESEKSSQASIPDWRFVPLDELSEDITGLSNNKHPPLFCIVVQRTQVLAGDECHCFIMKSNEAALALVRAISQVYASVKSGTKCLKSPIFYQLDRYGRKLTESNGVIYLSPATNDESLSITTAINASHIQDQTLPTKGHVDRRHLFDPSYGGFFYRTDTALIEQWQLWDDEDLLGSRPHPPASPFGLHEGLYHDDTQHETRRQLRHMEEDEHSCSCSCSSRSSSSSSEWRSRSRQRKRKSNPLPATDLDQFDASFSRLQTSSFEPPPTSSNSEQQKTGPTPIIIEKLVNVPLSIPVLNPTLPSNIQSRQKYRLEQPRQLFHNAPTSLQSLVPPESSLPDVDSFGTYHVNERGEKITKDGNRIVFMDVIQPNLIGNTNEPPIYLPSSSFSTSRPTKIHHHKSHRRRRSTPVPVLDIKSVERLFNEKRATGQRRTNIVNDDDGKATAEKILRQRDDVEHDMSTSDILQILDGFFEDNHGRKTNLDGNDAQAMLDRLRSHSKDRQQRRSSMVSSASSSKRETRHRRARSTFIGGPSMNYGERPAVMPLVQPMPPQPPPRRKYSIAPVFTNEQVSEYVSHIYGTAQKISQTSKSSSPSIPSSSTIHQETQLRPLSVPSDNGNITTATTAVTNNAYMSPFRYMQSSLNPMLFREYRHAHTGR